MSSPARLHSTAHSDHMAGLPHVGYTRPSNRPHTGARSLPSNGPHRATPRIRPEVTKRQPPAAVQRTLRKVQSTLEVSQQPSLLLHVSTYNCAGKDSRPRFADKTECMLKLMSKNARFDWCVEDELEIKQFKKEIASAPALKPYDTCDRSIACTGASAIGFIANYYLRKCIRLSRAGDTYGIPLHFMLERVFGEEENGKVKTVEGLAGSSLFMLY
ncbi:hypothetical protein NDU88_002649 [Pleurodeles waltl]|uniref:Uncharacterized protein n=1 Tax=Pleurodeles waltl TaxID=8319 RepID=A0AAV7QAI5_PLEWA|nr:hypothetical protein NDU88_002649 [Pleurodeles waltl]